MRRKSYILGLASSAVAVALFALAYDIDTHRSSSTVESSREEANQGHQTSSIDTEVNESTAGAILQNPTMTKDLSDTGYVSSNSIADEETSRKRVREKVTQTVHALYSFLLEDLDLTPSEKDALISLLIEDRIASTWTSYSRGTKIDEQDQSNRIAAIIGDPKLQQFRALERNLGEYARVHNIGSVFQQHGVALTDTQRDGLLKILVDVREQDKTIPGADAKRDSIEYLEYRLAQIDEYERLVMEQAQSVLSPKQVEYMFERYQYHSYQRAYALEAQRKARADNPDEDLPLWYPGWSE